jgi:hypothetical protein
MADILEAPMPLVAGLLHKADHYPAGYIVAEQDKGGLFVLGGERAERWARLEEKLGRAFGQLDSKENQPKDDLVAEQAARQIASTVREVLRRDLLEGMPSRLKVKEWLQKAKSKGEED